MRQVLRACYFLYCYSYIMALCGIFLSFDTRVSRVRCYMAFLAMYLHIFVLLPCNFSTVPILDRISGSDFIVDGQNSEMATYGRI